MTSSQAKQASAAPDENIGMDLALLAKLTGGLGDKKTIERISTDFAQLCSDILPDQFQAEMGLGIDVSYLGCKSGMMKELVADIGKDFALTDAALANWCPNFVLACGSSLVIALMETMLGASPDTVAQPEERALSDIELDLARMVFERIGKVLQLGVNAPGDDDVTLAAPHNAGKRPETEEFGRPEFGVAIRMEIELGSVTSQIALIIPQTAFLKTRIVSPKGMPGLSQAQQEWADRVNEQVRRSQVTLEARIPLQSLTLGAIARLAKGDVLTFQAKRDVKVKVSANGKDMYACDFGRSGERYTVRVKDNISTDHEILQHLAG